MPAGFCALVVGTIERGARHIVVAPNGDMFVSFNGRGRGASVGIVGLRDSKGTGKADVVGQPFGTGNTTLANLVRERQDLERPAQAGVRDPHSGCKAFFWSGLGVDMTNISFQASRSRPRVQFSADLLHSGSPFLGE